MSEVEIKERRKEKGISPHTPLKEKENQKEISSVPVPVHRTGAGACARVGAASPLTGSGTVDSFSESNSFFLPLHHGVSLRINDEEIRYSDKDTVALALATLRIPTISLYRDGRRYNNARIFRKLTKEIGEDVFREVLIQQLHENECDGEPKSRAAAFMAKLNAVQKEMKGGAK